MWNLKRLPSNVLLQVKIAFEENVSMASKKAAANENPKITKKGFFRRSESVMPNSYDKNMTEDTADVDTVDSDNKKQLIRRSSMICSEGFDKYTFDCHRHDIPVRSAGLDLEVTTTPEEPSHNQTSLVPENNVISSAQNSKPAATEHFNKPPAIEHFNIKKLTSFKPVSAVSPSLKTTPFSFKRVPEETIPPNIPLSNKRVPEETIPVNRAISFDIPSSKSPVTNIPLSFNPIPEGTKWINNTSPKTSMNKSAPVTTTPFSFRHISDESSPIRNAPLSFRRVPEELPRPVNRAFSFRSVSGQSDPFKNAFSQSEPIRNTPLSFKPVSEEFMPARNAPLSVKHVPEKTGSSSYAPLQTISDETIPHRNSPLSLKHVSLENMRNTSSSFHHFPNKPTTPVRDIPLSFEPVPEEPMPVRNSPLSLKDVPDEPIPSRNAPLFLKPILTKHMSLLKKKTPSVKSAIIKRDSVVHPERVDMQGSLCIAGRFQNPWPTWRPPTFANILKFGVTRNKSKVPPKQELDLVLPIVKQNFSKLTIPDDGIRVTWIGHSSVLIQMHNLNILTDPMFSDRASPSQVVGPKRYRDPPCSIHDLPHINAVVISHSHYDHLDSNTITLLNARFGADIRWFVPLGLQTWMEHVGCENVVELDWWEENCVPEHSDISFIFTPAQHWSKRTIGDDNKVLWGSWCILGPQYRFFFAGDTGYCDVFKQIGRVHGPFDLSAIPIGAYEPRWFMKYQHVNPEEAVQIHMDVKSKRSLAIHWGTFCLANEYYLDPPVKLREALDKNEIPPELFFTLKHGESRLIAQNNLVKRNPLSDKNISNS